MRTFIVILAAVVLAILVSSLPGNGGLVGRSLLMSVLAYLIFFHQRRTLPVTALIAITIVFELTGIMRFGSSSLFALCFWFSTTLFSEQLRFTSPFVRYIVSLLVLTFLLSFIGYPLSGFFHRLLILSLTLLPVIAATLTLSFAREVPEYELS